MTDQRLTVTKVHLALLSRLILRSQEGVPAVDTKRPYGNSDVLGDLREIYGEVTDFEIVKIEDGGTLVLDSDRVVSRSDGPAGSENFEDTLWRYHSEMTTVLEILIDNLSIDESTYIRSSAWGRRWDRV